MKVSPDSFQPTSVSGFIVLDGVNGAGKTTLQRAICSFLSSNSAQVISTREPGATAVGREIRNLVLNTTRGMIDPITELLLFGSDRSQHVRQLILPSLRNGAWVVSDRYYYSTVAFQGYGRKLDLETIRSVNDIATGGLRPDLVILLDLDPLEGLKRSQQRESSAQAVGHDTFEQETLDFHRNIRTGFLELAQSLPEPFLVLDASQKPEQLFNSISPVLDRMLRTKRATI